MIGKIEEYERIRIEAAKRLRERYMGYGYNRTSWEDTPYKEYWIDLVDAILGTDGIEIRSDDQGLPPVSYDPMVYAERMLNVGFVKVIPKKEALSVIP